MFNLFTSNLSLALNLIRPSQSFLPDTLFLIVCLLIDQEHTLYIIDKSTVYNIIQKYGKYFKNSLPKFQLGRHGATQIQIVNNHHHLTVCVTYIVRINTTAETVYNIFLAIQLRVFSTYYYCLSSIKEFNLLILLVLLQLIQISNYVQ